MPREPVVLTPTGTRISTTLSDHDEMPAHTGGTGHLTHVDIERRAIDGMRRNGYCRLLVGEM
jgi:hypothetical protein